MLFQSLLSATLALAATATPTPITNQKPILGEHDDPATQQVDLIKELEKANIIPTVLDPFTPLLTLNVTWKKAIADLGNSIKPKKAKKQPSIALFDVVPSFSNNYNGPVKPLNDKIQLTIALTDPDAPSAQDPEWSQICHWIATDVQLSPAASNIDADEDEDEDEDGDGRSTTASSKHKHPSSPSLTEIMPYKAPGPPPSTGSHRYVFVALAPLNATTEKLNLSVPKDRKRWGFEGERAGLREWARENGLGVVGANFVYSKNKKQ